ncbi:uncharacterized protein si:ch211-178n15.1 [Alosa sapidissima]|uniref:uncharacterized protein si:ch211-178n15.1 n=1 Tax=Alosa sapidissima TaxID=34773 RepID=UPI001C08C2EF|nr:uncharacterized protein si:ch211-178n15.1 [Alosa sapidissima]
MLSPTSDVSAAARGPGPGYVLRRPPAAADPHCYCHLCARDRPSATAPAALAPEFHSGPRVRASPEEEEGVAVLEGPRARRPFPSQRRSRRGSGEGGPERNGVTGGHIPPKNTSRRVDFYLGPDHCSVLGDHTPGFPREWGPCYSPPPRWNWPAVEPCRERCACPRDVWPEWERTPLPPPPLPPLPRPPCCYSPERQPPSTSHVPHQPSAEIRAHPRHRAVVHGGLGEPCWECLRDHYWRDAHRPDLIAVEPVCGYNVQHHPALSPVLSYGREHQRLSRQTSPEHGNFNGPTPGPRTFFATEVPPAKLRGSYQEELASCRLKSASRPQRIEPELDGRKEKKMEKESMSGAVGQHQSQGNVREQIRRVVGDLEEVLGGLKQVHLEMKEVVQQIDVLTSSIDIDEDEPGRRTSHEPVLQQHTVYHEVKALVHRPAGAHSSQEQKQQQQLLGTNGHHTPTTPTPTSKPSTCHPSVTRRGHTTAGNLPRAAALIPGHEAAKDQSKMNGSCLAPRPPRDRVKDAQRRRIELSSPSSSLIANGAATTSVKGHKSPPYPNHNGRVETLHEDSDVSMGALRTTAHAGKGRQLSTAM